MKEPAKAAEQASPAPHPWTLSTADGRSIDFYHDRPLPVESVVVFTRAMAELMEKMPELKKLTLRIETEAGT